MKLMAWREQALLLEKLGRGWIGIAQGAVCGEDYGDW